MTTSNVGCTAFRAAVAAVAVVAAAAAAAAAAAVYSLSVEWATYVLCTYHD